MTNTDMSKDSDSGQIITSSDILLHDAKTALLYEELRAAIDDGHESMTHADALAEIAAIRAENEKLHAELASIGAGWVNGPLMGQPQAMPDLSQIKERGAKAWAGVDAQGLREGRWYMVNKDGMATLCADEADAQREAADAQAIWPGMGPHSAVQLVDAGRASLQSPSFSAEDMATASAQGFRDGVASISANAESEPVYQARYQKGFWQDSSRERCEYLQNPENTCAEDWETRILYTRPPTSAEGVEHAD